MGLDQDSDGAQWIIQSSIDITPTFLESNKFLYETARLRISFHLLKIFPCHSLFWDCWRTYPQFQESQPKTMTARFLAQFKKINLLKCSKWFSRWNNGQRNKLNLKWQLKLTLKKFTGEQKKDRNKNSTTSPSNLDLNRAEIRLVMLSHNAVDNLTLLIMSMHKARWVELKSGTMWRDGDALVLSWCRVSSSHLTSPCLVLSCLISRLILLYQFIPVGCVVIVSITDDSFETELEENFNSTTPRSSSFPLLSCSAIPSPLPQIQRLRLCKTQAKLVHF